MDILNSLGVVQRSVRTCRDSTRVSRYMGVLYRSKGKQEVHRDMQGLALRVSLLLDIREGIKDKTLEAPI